MREPHKRFQSVCMLDSWKADCMNARHPCSQYLQHVCMELLDIIFESLRAWRTDTGRSRRNRIVRNCCMYLALHLAGVSMVCSKHACCHVEGERDSTEVSSCLTKRMSLQCSTCLCSLNSMMVSGSQYFGGTIEVPCCIVVFADFAKPQVSLFRGAGPSLGIDTDQSRFRGPGL